MITKLNLKNKFKVKPMCEILNVSRTAYLNSLKTKDINFDTLLIAEIKSILGSTRKYGYRRVTHELKKRRFVVNHKKVLKLMRNNNLLCKPNRKYKITTNSNHNLSVYPNLIKNIAVSNVNQVWVADITYIHLNSGFCYLAAVIDLFSRKVVGFDIRLDMSDELTVNALNMALNQRNINNNMLIHHSDRGSQYASKRYTRLLNDFGIKISMSRTANPYDNAYAESFMKTLKNEEVYMNEYDDFCDVVKSIKFFIEDVYNKKRLHSSLGYVSPNEFEFANSSVSKVLNFAVLN